MLPCLRTSLIAICLFYTSGGLARPHSHESHPSLSTYAIEPVCRAPIAPDDYAAKSKADLDLPVCPNDYSYHSIFRRQTAAPPADDYSCSESKPCSNGACCSKKTGYCNYGPEACGPDLGKNPSPNEVCWSNCNAIAECGQFALPVNKTCPLNVCCSAFGFCGTTSDFCSDTCQSNCKQPDSDNSNGDVQSRIIGYYEAWAHNKSCQSMDFKVRLLSLLHQAVGSIHANGLRSGHPSWSSHASALLICIHLAHRFQRGTDGWAR